MSFKLRIFFLYYFYYIFIKSNSNWFAFCHNFNCSYKVKLIIPNVATKYSPTKQTKEIRNPTQPPPPEPVQEPNQEPTTQAPKPKQQRAKGLQEIQEKRPTQCKKFATPKNKRMVRSGGVAWSDTGVEVGCL